MSIRLDDIKDPKLRQRIEKALGAGSDTYASVTATTTRKGDAVPDPARPLLNETEQRWRTVLEARGYKILQQAITLALDPPFRSYRPDLAYIKGTYLTLVEVKGPHRFREKGIAKAALAAKTYPQFRFELADWTGSEWKESEFSH